MQTPRIVVALLLLAASAPVLAQPLGTAFTYQGELRTSGVPTSGPHDLRFRLYDAASGGNQVGSTICSDDIATSEGRFTIVLDFGSQFSGQQRFLEIDVRADTGLGCANGAGFITLAPRQPLTGAPNAIFALTAASASTASTAASATNAGQLNGQTGAFYQNAGNLTSGTIPDARISGVYSGALALSNASNTITGAFSGSGAGLIGLNASSIVNGTLADARLTANVAMLHTNQTFTGGKAFSTAPAFTAAAGSPFFVTSNSLVANLNADLLDGVHASAFLQSIPVPLTLSGSNPLSHIISGENAAATNNSYGVYGRSTAGSGVTYGIFGRTDSTNGIGTEGFASAPTGQTIGVRGTTSSPDGRGVYGYATGLSGTTTGVWGRTSSTSGRAVFGTAEATSGVTYGGRFENDSTSGFGVFGRATAASGDTFGLWGQSDSTSGFGVFGEQTATSGTTHGVYGRSASTAGRGLFGYASAASGATYGGYFQTQSTGGYGAFGYATATSGTTYGLFGQSDSTAGRGVYGLASTSSGTNYGVYGRSDSTSGRGVYGLASATTGTNHGGYFQSDSTTGRGVIGYASATTGDTRGGYFSCWSTAGTGVHGLAFASSGTTNGGRFESWSTSGWGVYGTTSATGAGDTPYGVRGYASTATSGYAVYALGDMGASGVKPFRIDHPSDPENKYLLHYAAESPEVINFYRGTVTLDGAGEAVVELPPYFASINKDPSYQLTAVGAPMPMLHLAEEVTEAALAEGERAGPGVVPPICSFRIAGGAAGGKVSWRVEALRNDLRIRLHGAPVEREKTGPERGKYQHPEYYGQPPERGMDASSAPLAKTGMDEVQSDHQK